MSLPRARLFVSSALACVAVSAGTPAFAQYTVPVPPLASVAEGRGIGAGGWMWSAAFHPSNSDLVLMGGDNCGVFRSEDGGASWEPWIEGLANANEGIAMYVDDLVGVSYGGNQGFYAATITGIYAAQGHGAWQWETTSDDGYVYDPAGDTWKNRAQLIPFACLDWDGSSLLVAGAGRVRHGNGDYYAAEAEYYPALPSSRWDSNIPDSPPGGASSWEQWAVWTKDLASGTSAPWLPDDDTGFPSGAARDIAVGFVGTNRYLTVATSEGIYLKQPNGWLTLPDIDLDPGSGTTLGNTRCWSVQLTSRGALYAAFDLPPGTKYHSPGPVSGVYRIADVTASSPGSWEYVGNDASTCQIAPHNRTMKEIGERTSLPFLTVVERTNSDRLYVGAKWRVWEPNATTKEGNLGVYRADVSTSQSVSNVCWSHVLYRKGPGDWFPASTEPGWADYWDEKIMYPPVVDPGDPLRLLVESNDRAFLSEDGGATWENIATKDVSPSEGHWQSTGFHQQNITDIAFRADGRLLMQSGDHGVFQGIDARNEAFEWLTGPAGARGEVATLNGAGVEVTPDTRGSGAEIAFATTDRVYWIDPDNVMYDIGAPTNRAYWHFSAVSESELWVPFDAYDTDGKQLGGGVSVGRMTERVRRDDVPDPEPEEWVWTDTAFDAPPSGYSHDVAAYVVMRHRTTGIMLMGARRSGEGRDGGLFYYDEDASKWARAIPATSDQKNFESLAQSTDGSFIYAGSNGYGDSKGGVLRCDLVESAQDPDFSLDDPSTWTWEPISDGNTFGFDVPFNRRTPYANSTHSSFDDWTATETGDSFTQVLAIAVDPTDPTRVYIGLSSPQGSFPQKGVWCYHRTPDTPAGEWTQLPRNARQLRGINVKSLVIPAHNPNVLFIGTGGHELYTLDLANGTLRWGVSALDAVPVPPPLAVTSVTPSPASGLSRIRFSAPGADVQIGIYDVAGRLVRRLHAPGTEPGPREVTWDGTGENRAAVGSGVYYARLRAGAQRTSVPIVRVR